MNWDSEDSSLSATALLGAEWYLLFLEDWVLMEEMLSIREEWALLPTHAIHSAPLNFKEKPPTRKLDLF